MILVSQQETVIVLSDNYIIHIHQDENKEKNKVVIQLIASNGGKYEMGSYATVNIAQIIIKKFIDAKIREDKIFKFMDFESLNTNSRFFKK
jgi:hypothetical protein